jgi:hypothetical protein
MSADRLFLVMQMCRGGAVTPFVERTIPGPRDNHNQWRQDPRRGMRLTGARGRGRTINAVERIVKPSIQLAGLVVENAGQVVMMDDASCATVCVADNGDLGKGDEMPRCGCAYNEELGVCLVKVLWRFGGCPVVPRRRGHTRACTKSFGPYLYRVRSTVAASANSETVAPGLLACLFAPERATRCIAGLVLG